MCKSSLATKEPNTSGCEGFSSFLAFSFLVSFLIFDIVVCGIRRKVEDKILRRV